MILLFSCSVVSNSLWPHGLQHARLPRPYQLPEHAQTHVHQVGDVIQPSHPLSSPTPRLQSFPASGSFLKIWLFTSGGQSIGASVSASVPPMRIQDWFPLRWTGWISLQSKRLSRVFSNTTVWKHQFFSAQPSLWSNCHKQYDNLCYISTDLIMALMISKSMTFSFESLGGRLVPKILPILLICITDS